MKLIILILIFYYVFNEEIISFQFDKRILNVNNNIKIDKNDNIIKRTIEENKNIFIEIDFDINKSKNERICLFCNRMSNKTNEYEFGIIKSGNKY